MDLQNRYQTPSLATDIVVFAIDQDNLKVMLVRRGIEPFQNQWALPGGFVRIDESVADCAKRELEEETGLRNVFVEQLFTFGDTDRDPRGRVVSVAYFALVNVAGRSFAAGTDARQAAWFAVDEVPSLAFDHDEILSVASQRLQNKVRYQPVGFELLPEKFPLRSLQKLYEIVLGRRLDKRNFRKKIQSYDFVVAADEREKNVSHRAAQLFRFDKKKYDRWTKKGLDFEL